ncbi:MAG: hypothetical protein AAGG02_01385 [Cyanobacteria bacterium P01_H01_bin.15]
MASFPPDPNLPQRPHQGLSSKQTPSNRDVAEQFRQASLYVDRRSMGRFFVFALIFGLILGGVVATGVVVVMRHFGLNEVTPIRQSEPVSPTDSI